MFPRQTSVDTSNTAFALNPQTESVCFYMANVRKLIDGACYCVAFPNNYVQLRNSDAEVALYKLHVSNAPLARSPSANKMQRPMIAIAPAPPPWAPAAALAPGVVRGKARWGESIDWVGIQTGMGMHKITRQSPIRLNTTSNYSIRDKAQQTEQK